MTIILATLILGISMVVAMGMLCTQLDKMDKDNISYHATKCCLVDLVNELNNKFPGSSLIVKDHGDSVKVLGELKYLKKS